MLGNLDAATVHTVSWPPHTQPGVRVARCMDGLRGVRRRAAVDPEDLLGPRAHTDQALSLLDSVPPSAGPTDLLVWTLRLADLHEALVAAGSAQP
jgi:hypothetical protein